MGTVLDDHFTNRNFHNSRNYQYNKSTLINYDNFFPCLYSPSLIISFQASVHHSATPLPLTPKYYDNFTRAKHDEN